MQVGLLRFLVLNEAYFCLGRGRCDCCGFLDWIGVFFASIAPDAYAGGL